MCHGVVFLRRFDLREGMFLTEVATPRNYSALCFALLATFRDLTVFCMIYSRHSSVFLLRDSADCCAVICFLFHICMRLLMTEPCRAVGKASCVCLGLFCLCAVLWGPSFTLRFSILASLTSSFLKKKKNLHLHKCTSSHQSTDTLPSICLFLPRIP